MTCLFLSKRVIYTIVIIDRFKKLLCLTMNVNLRHHSAVQVALQLRLDISQSNSGVINYGGSDPQREVLLCDCHLRVLSEHSHRLVWVQYATHVHFQSHAASVNDVAGIHPMAVSAVGQIAEHFALRTDAIKEHHRVLRRANAITRASQRH